MLNGRKVDRGVRNPHNQGEDLTNLTFIKRIHKILIFFHLPYMFIISCMVYHCPRPFY